MAMLPRMKAATFYGLVLIVWPSLFEERRRVILAAGMMGVRSRVQCEGEVIARHDAHQRLLPERANITGPATKRLPRSR